MYREPFTFESPFGSAPVSSHTWCRTGAVSSTEFRASPVPDQHAAVESAL